MSFFQELKRRNVFRVGIAYVLVAWVLLQGADFALDLTGAPNWVIQALSIAVITGLPIALVIAWAFELTPEGVKKAEDVDPQAERRRPLSLLQYVFMALVVAVLSYFLYQARPDARTDTQPSSTSGQQTAPDSTTAANTSPSGTSIAVLPFVNMSDDESQEYFSDGISEELLNVLSRVPGLRVSSRTSSFAFKGVNRNIREIASILGVNHILEGSVRKAGNQVRITAQLIDTATDRHIWSNTFDRELNDIFAIQDEISSAIVSALQDALGMQEEATIGITPATSNMDAYDLYLQALGLASVLSVENAQRKVELLQQAVEADPDFILGWAELADSLVQVPTWDHSLSMQEYNGKARQAAEKALSLDPDNALANLALAEVLAGEYNWTGWQQQLGQARALYAGDQAGTVRLLSFASETWLGLGYLSRALEAAEAGLALEADHSFLHLMKSLALLDLGRREEALIHFEQATLLGYAGGAANDLWEYVVPQDRRAVWAAIRGVYFQDHDPELLQLLPHLSRVLFAEPVDREIERRRFWQVANELGFSRESVLQKGPLWGYRLAYGTMAALGEHEPIAGQFWGNSPFFWMWAPSLQPFRQSQVFKSNVRTSGMLKFWRDTEWPDLCRPLPEDDFECD